jgi:hypothetical protein
LNVPFALEPISNHLPASSDGNQGCYQKKPDDHLNDTEVHGIAGNKPPGDYGCNDHDRAKNPIQHIATPAGRYLENTYLGTGQHSLMRVNKRQAFRAPSRHPAACLSSGE